MPRNPSSPLNPVFRESVKTATNLPVTQTADLRGITVDLRGPAASAGAVPQIDARGFIAQAGAGAAIGRAVSDAGDELAKIQMRQMEAINIRKEAEAMRSMDEEDARILAEIKNEPDETKWHDIAENRISALKTRLLDKEANPLSPVALSAITDRLEGWASRRRANIITQSADHSRQRAADEINGQIIRSMDRGDYGTARQLAQRGVEAGYFGDDQAARLEVEARKHAEAKQREAMTNQVIAVARTQGKAAADDLIEKSNADEVDKERWRSDAAQIHREQVGQDADAFEEAVYSGALSVPGEVDAWQQDNPRITSRMREQMKGFLTRKNDAMRKEVIRANAPELSSQYLSEIRALDPETATDEEFNAIRLKIAELPEGYRELPHSRLMTKFNKADDPIKPEHEVIETVEAELDGYLGAGLFSADTDPQLMPVPLDQADVYTAEEIKAMTPEQRAASKGNKAAIEAENKKIQARIDAAAKQRKAQVGGQVSRWLKANPKATPAEALQFMREKLPASTRAGMFDAFDMPSTVEGNGAQNDLPTRGGPVENTLLPPLLNPIR